MATGKVIQVIGPVVDIEFPPEQLPDIYNAVEIPLETQGAARHRDRSWSPRCSSTSGNNWVRCVAMGTTDGLRRGVEAVDTGGPITVPVGPPTLGRIFNVLGQADRRGRRRSTSDTLLPDPPARAVLRGAGDSAGDVRDRHQGHRPDRPLPQGRQDRRLRRRRRRQDGHHPGADPQRRRRSTAAARSSPAWASARARGTTSGTR